MTKEKPPPGAPYIPAPYDLPEIAAIQALVAGEATPDQQRRAVSWIVEKAACTYDVSYRPTSDRDTAFAEGKRFVGLMIVKLAKIDKVAYKARIKQEEENAT